MEQTDPALRDCYKKDVIAAEGAKLFDLRLLWLFAAL